MRYKRKKENKMPALVIKSQHTLQLQSKLDFITKKADVLKSHKGMIELNQNNEKHREWFEVDKYKGQ